MMISMTGYGSGSTEFRQGHLQLEIKSVNSKGIDLALRIPQWLKDKEIELRKRITDILYRGKVEFTITEVATKKDPSIDWDLLENYLIHLKKFQEEHNIQDPNLLSALLQMPELQKNVSESISDEELQALLTALDNTIQQLMSFRIQEGVAMEKYILERISTIKDIQQKIAIEEPNRTEKLRKKLGAALEQKTPSLLDQNRLEQEMIYYIEKLDIQEELSRLSAHVHYFAAIAKDENPEKGKRLGFIAQELLREANTIGAKANDAEIQQLVVLLKDEIEKIKEQLNNII